MSQTLKPEECSPEDSCYCYTEKDLRKLAKGIMEMQMCKIQLDKAEGFIANTQHKDDEGKEKEYGIVGFIIGILATIAVLGQG